MNLGTHRAMEPAWITGSFASSGGEGNVAGRTINKLFRPQTMMKPGEMALIRAIHGTTVTTTILFKATTKPRRQMIGGA